MPKHLVVIGGGYIGLEMGSVWRRLGAEVTVVEFLDRILPGMDGEVSKQMQRLLQKQGITFKLGTKVTAAVPGEAGVDADPRAGRGRRRPRPSTADVVLVAIGRRPYTEGLGLEAVGVAARRARAASRPTGITPPTSRASMPSAMSSPGRCWPTRRRTKASRSAEILAGQAGHVNYDAIPGVVYTWPEVASVGKTEEQLKAAGIAYKVGKFPFTANGRARAMAMTDGFVKILADAGDRSHPGRPHRRPRGRRSDRRMRASAMEFAAAAEDIARTCHAHPTLNEAVKEAALAVDGRAIHI